MQKFGIRLSGIERFTGIAVGLRLQKFWIILIELSVSMALERHFGSLMKPSWPWNGVWGDLLAPSWHWNGVKLALERRLGRPGGAKLALERRFGRPGGAKLALERRFGCPGGAKLALERRFVKNSVFPRENR